MYFREKKKHRITSMPHSRGQVWHSGVTRGATLSLRTAARAPRTPTGTAASTLSAIPKIPAPTAPQCGRHKSVVLRGVKATNNKISMENLAKGIFVFAGVLSLTYMAVTQRRDFDDTPAPGLLNPAWMASVPDSRPLSEVTLPGSHNTMARYGGAPIRCQSWPLALQLRAGVRFLDVRVRHVKGNLTIHHGVVYQRAHFGDVLEDVAAFLHERPTEAVLMRLKEEFSETNDIYGSVVSYIHRYAHWDLLWHSRLVPTMTQARGKLIVLQDFIGPDLGMRYGSLDIADEWKVPTFFHLPAKWETVHKHLAAAEAGNKAQMFLTYSSGAGIFAYPISVARHINARLLDHLVLRAGKPRRYGIVAMDFPDAPLLQTIINFN
ncbi:1-phosphatidylinositol phosphodiesterase isoform X2 [Brienomyrus brachyistius]|uniref:1-phosphatidylinositol phosphodiesterase isoform X2 n=1 Tax=Brienomyrus brachyistius TaxID=42636 RepID=UPI0020B2AD14|nr:1-phosphatidylinositol phosphodiesterase isoform X2 [Brienomyrus brachyistius]